MKISGKMSQSSRLWLERQRTDIYSKRAINEGYRSRAAYKLLEIDDKFRLIKDAKAIVDLGAAPGGWSQVIHKRLLEHMPHKGCSKCEAIDVDSAVKIAAVDLLPFDPIADVESFCGDFEDELVQQVIVKYLGQNADLIVSDMAPSATGHRKSDHIRIMRLVESAYYFAREVLAFGGSFIVKIFQGGEEQKFFELIKKDFKNVRFFKPSASRKESSEIYIIAMQYKYNKL